MTLSAEDAEARSALISVSHYDVLIDLTDVAERSSFTSSTTVRFLCSEAGGGTWIDLIARDVSRIQLNGVELDYTHPPAAERIALTDLAEYNVLVIDAEHDTGTGRGLSRSVDASDGAVYAWTQFQPFDARRAFACFDQPDLKAPLRITARVPREWSCVSNGRVRAVVGDGPDRVWSFTETPPLPTYVAALCAGPFHIVSADCGEVAIALHARRSLADVLERDAPELIELTRQGLAHYGDQFGMRYASDSYDYVFLPDLPGAMENFGCVTWSDAALYRSTATRAERDRRQIVLLHEMAHMWFGNLVTLRWWDGLWLNEAFADWAAFWTAAVLADDDRPWAQFLLTHKSRAYAADQAPTTHAVSVDVPDVDAAEANFDLITYAKGASVLGQLVAWVGADLFLAALRNYFARYAWQNTDLAGFLAELEAVSGRDLTEWAAQWLQTPQVNTLRLDAPVHAGRYGQVTVQQSSTPVLRAHRLQIGVYDSGPDGALELRESIELDVTGPLTTVKALHSAQRAAVLLPNDGDLTFAKVRLDPASLAELLTTGHTLPTPLARAVAVTAIRDMVLDAQLPASALVGLIVQSLRVELHPATVAQLLATAVEAATVYSAANDRPAALESIAAACLGARAATADAELQRAYDLGLAQTATAPAQLDALDTLLADARTDQALRWTILTRLAAVDRVTAASLDAEADRDRDPDAALRAVAARAARGTAATKRAALDRLLEDPSLPVSALQRIADSIWQPGQEELLETHAERYLDALPALVANGASATLRNVIAYTFPSFGVTDALVARARALAATIDASPASRNALRDKVNLLEGALRARRITLTADRPN